MKIYIVVYIYWVMIIEYFKIIGDKIVVIIFYNEDEYELFI